MRWNGNGSLSKIAAGLKLGNSTADYYLQRVVSLVHTESEDEIRVISFRKATRREANISFEEIEN